MNGLLFLLDQAGEALIQANQEVARLRDELEQLRADTTQPKEN